ncbi:urease accessory protein UreF [Celerinatantimonas sp. MCCC 1A17872]|uniref:urease accessory protein UreF n=1 Tax=Celerinatantimonas sp. MCCC 1A17872 TaxID=3177514 RepID=UPI0038C5DF28
MDTTITDLALLRLMHLSSAALPIGGYSFSQGLEFSIDNGTLKTPEQIAHWLSEQLQQSLVYVDLPLLKRVYHALLTDDLTKARDYNDWLLACRESFELHQADTAMGAALAKLLPNFGINVPDFANDQLSYVSLYALAAVNWHIPYQQTACGFLSAWLENQVAAATKLVPLGQTQAQKLIHQLQPALITAISQADALDEDQIGMGLPMFGILSAHHETQYSRLFRS